ncbi:neuronal acetylcholine receptor subunit beta-2-like [Cydia pomonella]|uniref:neuronal acetylcholine receptor subunit beta-2-like n=1 Tax=Cydia pomonella TaxID=82600 RepID=UPI002ADD7A26|nr:neuronal acetylcholine receptor subunit beta-2-like [Cydia pomonella]
MASYTYICILAIIIKFSYGQDCALESLWPSEVPVEKRLETKILNCYDYRESPNSNTTKRVEVEVAYMIQMLRFDDQEEVLTIYSWTIMEWEDARLKWDLDHYKGIKTTILNFYDIWTPELKVKNYEIEDSESFITIYECLVNNTGHVRCIQSNVHSLMCSSAMKDWPYDRKYCNLKIDDDSWSQSEANIVFTKFKFLSFEDTYTAWRLIHSEEHLNLTRDYQASIEFVLERVAEGLEAAIVVPAFVMSVLTIITFFLNVNANVRLGMLCTSLFSHYLFLTEVNKSIPKHSVDAPKILLFITGSMTMTLMNIVLTLTLKYLCSRKSSPPVLVTSINYLILNGYGEYLVFPRWSAIIDNKSVLDSISQETEWFDFSNIINSIVFIVSVITYIVMYSIYLPHEDYIPTTN